MSINLHLPSPLESLRPTITVIGVGGAGGNAVNNMISAQLEGVDFVMANTDAQALQSAQTSRTIQLGASITKGLGAGADPDTGRAAAEEAAEEIMAYIQGSNMVFITAGMGGGTGTGAAPVVARMAREQGILTVAVVTKPFQFEGANRMRLAERGLQELQQYVDTLIVIPNQNLFRLATEKTTFAQAFRMADEVLHSGVRGVTDLMVRPGLVNLDFADIRTVMREMGKAMMGTGEATGERRAIEAAEAAISNPLLDEVSLKGARAALINITGGADMTLFELDEAANRIREEIDADANIIFGSTFSEEMEGIMRVSVVATGIESSADSMSAQQTEAATMRAASMRRPFSYLPPAQAPHTGVQQFAEQQQEPVRVARPVMQQAAPQPYQQHQPARTERPAMRPQPEPEVAQAAAQAAASQQQSAPKHDAPGNYASRGGYGRNATYAAHTQQRSTPVRPQQQEPQEQAYTAEPQQEQQNYQDHSGRSQQAYQAGLFDEPHHYDDQQMGTEKKNLESEAENEHYEHQAHQQRLVPAQNAREDYTEEYTPAAQRATAPAVAPRSRQRSVATSVREEDKQAGGFGFLGKIAEVGRAISTRAEAVVQAHQEQYAAPVTRSNTTVAVQQHQSPVVQVQPVSSDGGTNSTDEDLYDIPAFLRRQAN